MFSFTMEQEALLGKSLSFSPSQVLLILLRRVILKLPTMLAVIIMLFWLS